MHCFHPAVNFRLEPMQTLDPAPPCSYWSTSLMEMPADLVSSAFSFSPYFSPSLPPSPSIIHHVTGLFGLLSLDILLIRGLLISPTLDDEANYHHHTNLKDTRLFYLTIGCCLPYVGFIIYPLPLYSMWMLTIVLIVGSLIITVSSTPYPLGDVTNIPLILCRFSGWLVLHPPLQYLMRMLTFLIMPGYRIMIHLFYPSSRYTFGLYGIHRVRTSFDVNYFDPVPRF